MATYRLYRVKWVGYREMTWEPDENLPKHIVKKYEDEQEAKKQAKKRNRGG